MVERMAVKRSPLAAFAPRSAAAKAFADLWTDIEGLLIAAEAQPI